MLYEGNDELVYYSRPGFYGDLLYQDYLGTRDSVLPNSIIEVGLRYTYYTGEFGDKSGNERIFYYRSHVDVVLGAGVRVFRRDCSEGFIIAGITAGALNTGGDWKFAPTAYLKGGFHYFNRPMARSHGPFLMISMQDAFFLNDLVADQYWVLFGVNVGYGYRF